VLDITDYFLKGVFIYVRLEVDTLEKKKSEAMLCYFIARDLFEEVCMSSRLSNYRCLLPSLRIVATAINNLQQIVNVAKKIESTEQCVLSSCFYVFVFRDMLTPNLLRNK